MKVTGACHCGAITIEGEADPEKVGILTLLTSGKAPITIARLALNRWMRTDFAETKRMLMSGETRLYTGGRFE